MKAFKKLSPAQQRDFDAYCEIAKSIKATQIEDYNSDRVAQTLEEWYWLWDTHGIRARFSDPQQAFRLTQAKDSLNLTIALWVEDVLNERFPLTVNEVWEYCGKLPEWVWRSFTRQLEKHPRPFRYQQVVSAPFSQAFWPPWMWDFDAII